MSIERMKPLLPAEFYGSGTNLQENSVRSGFLYATQNRDKSAVRSLGSGWIGLRVNRVVRAQRGDLQAARAPLLRGAWTSHCYPVRSATTHEPVSQGCGLTQPSDQAVRSAKRKLLAHVIGHHVPVGASFLDEVEA